MKLEDALEMLDLEWSKDNDTKMQCNRLNTSPLHRGNASNKNGPGRVKRRMQWEAPSKPLVVDDPLLLPEREVHAEIGINWFLDQEIPQGGYVRILAESLLWEEERDCFYYIIIQTYEVGLHSRRHPMGRTPW